jgi:hypothetical protein
MMHRSAVISECGRYRHILRRSWDISRHGVTFIMLNPSTADGEQDDPTVRKCIGFADRLGYGHLNIVNLFDFRATKPKDLFIATDTISPECLWWIIRSIQECPDVICAWGANARGLPRADEVLRLAFAVSGGRVRALRLLGDGTPEHPLMIPYAAQPVALTRPST